MASDNFARFFAETVRRRRKEKNLSQEQLAEKADLSSKMISLVERGQRIPSISVADAMARGLSVRLWRIVKDAEDLRLEERTGKKR
jgi:transcriptional regulator with XRE-family HTH domain